MLYVDMGEAGGVLARRRKLAKSPNEPADRLRCHGARPKSLRELLAVPDSITGRAAHLPLLLTEW